VGEVSRDQWGITSGLRPWNPDDPYGVRCQASEISVDALNAMIVKSGAHDRMMWEGPGDRNQNEVNVRFQTKVRGCTTTMTKRPYWMRAWRRSAWSYQNDTWSMIERESVDSRGVRVAGGHVKVVIMYQPPCADYKLRSLPAPPKPPRPPRLLGKPPVR